MANEDRGAIHITIGTVALVLGVVFSLASDQYIYYGACVFGAAQIVRGLVKRADRTGQPLAAPVGGALVHDAAGGVRIIEDVKATWQCPKCDAGNPNTSFVCLSCGMRLA